MYFPKSCLIEPVTSPAAVAERFGMHGFGYARSRIRSRGKDFFSGLASGLCRKPAIDYQTYTGGSYQ